MTREAAKSGNRVLAYSAWERQWVIVVWENVASRRGWCTDAVGSGSGDWDTYKDEELIAFSPLPDNLADL